MLRINPVRILTDSSGASATDALRMTALLGLSLGLSSSSLPSNDERERLERLRCMLERNKCTKAFNIIGVFGQRAGTDAPVVMCSRNLQ
mmetsp:Transcript_37900/g.64741  ORF Transcript_37900/g.64741 Transcript_37900/m.64741 type:complete len:89 (+) Transcript_37900:110-376(+)